MPSSRSGSLLLSALALAACGVAETAPPAIAAAPEAEAPADSLAAEAADPPDLSLQERWRSPFAVVSRGRTAPRPERAVFVPGDSTRAPAPEERPERRSADVGPRTHEVERGETWYGIARRYGVAPAALAAVNPGANPERIRSGQVLRIPSATAPARGQRTHTVAGGDSLWGIARRYGVTVEQIRAANRLPGDRVRIGQTLVIPSTEEGR